MMGRPPVARRLEKTENIGQLWLSPEELALRKNVQGYMVDTGFDD
jgi:hypothetical protein